MKARTIVVLSILLALCVGYVVVSQWGRLFGTDGSSDKRYVFGQPAEGLVSLTIQGADGRRINLRLAEGGWRITDPLTAKANGALVSHIAAVVRELKFTRRIPQNGQNGGNRYGLAKPAWQIRAVTNDGRELELLVGAQAPAIGSGRVKTYVRPGGGSDVCVVDVDFSRLLDRPAVDFRDKQLLAVPPGEIVRLSIAGKRRYGLQRSGDGWEIVLSPELTVPADSDAAWALIGRVTALRASGFVEADAAEAARLGLTESDARLVLDLAYRSRPGQGSASSSPTAQVSILLGRQDAQNVYAKLTGEDTVFLVDAEALAELQPDPTLLRRRRLMDLRPADISHVAIDAPAGYVELARMGGRWRMLQPLASPADEESVEQLLYVLSVMQAEAFHDQTPAAVLGLDDPKATITVDRTDGGQVVLTIGSRAPDGTGTFVRAGSQSTAATVSPAVARLLLNGPGHYFSRKIGAIHPDAKVIRLVLSRPDGTFTAELDDEGHWQMLAPTVGRADDEVIERIISHIKDLRAREIVSWSKRLPDIYRSEFSSAVITAVTVDPASQPSADPPTQIYVLRIVRLYDEWSGLAIGDFAWAPGTKPPMVGKVDPNVFRDLMANIAWRRLWDIDPATVRQIRIAQGSDEPIVLRREDDRWVVADDPYARVNVAVVADYLEAVKQLSAQEYLADTTAHLSRFGLDTPWLTVQLTNQDGEVYRIVVADHGPDESTLTRYASASGVDVVFLISTDTIGRLARQPGEFQAD